MFARSTTTPWPLVALFTAGYLAPYLLPTTVGRLDAGLPLSATQAGAVGSALLLSSAAAGFLLASRVDRVGPRTLARIGLALAVLGYGSAALTHALPAVIAGAVVGGFGSGTATTVAASGIAAMEVPPREGVRAWGEGPPPRLHARLVVRVGTRGRRLSDGPARPRTT